MALAMFWVSSEEVSFLASPLTLKAKAAFLRLILAHIASANN